MKIKFKIIQILEIKERVFVIVEQISKNNFEITNNSKIGNAPINIEFDIPRLSIENGQQIYNQFVFSLKSNEDRNNLRLGEVLELNDGE